MCLSSPPCLGSPCREEMSLPCWVNPLPDNVPGPYGRWWRLLTGTSALPSAEPRGRFWLCYSSCVLHSMTVLAVCWVLCSCPRGCWHRVPSASSPSCSPCAAAPGAGLAPARPREPGAVAGL